MSNNKFTVGSKIIYNDSRAGHRNAEAIVLEVDNRSMRVQFKDRAGSTLIHFKEKAWMDFIKTSY